MKIYTKFIVYIFLKSLFFVTGIILCLVFILNLLTELDFFKENEVRVALPLLLSLLNSPSMIFEMFPFIFLITIQLFFVKLFKNNEIEIFKYSGLKNTSILTIVSITSILSAILISTVFYNFSSNLKNFYLEIKSKYTTDGKYLAVITKNGLWIKDKIDNKIIITNSSSIKENFLINNFITEFDDKFNVVRNIQSDKIDITDNKWIIIDAKIYQQNNYTTENKVNLKTNFNSERIQSLYSNLSSLSLYEIYELRKNYKKLNYSITDIDLHIYKILSNPIYLLLITIFSSLIMFNIKQFKSSTFKISIGLFFSVVIYYLNNFSYVLGSTERISLIFSIFFPLLILTIVNLFMLNRINDK